MISGKEFMEICDWNLCNRYPLSFELDKVLEKDFVFLNTSLIYSLIELLNNYEFKKRLNFVVHNSDLSFDQHMFERLEKFSNHIFCINSIVSNDKITKIPLGFSDKLVKIIDRVDSETDKKNILVYMNFLISTNITERKECYDIFKNKQWVQIGDYLGHDETDKQINFWEDVKNSKYCICPVGAGLDTHRFWESLYFGTIPIVKRNELSDLYETLPCVVVEKWNEIDEEYLQINYEKYLKKYKKWKKENPNWVFSKFWIKNERYNKND